MKHQKNNISLELSLPKILLIADSHKELFTIYKAFFNKIFHVVISQNLQKAKRKIQEDQPDIVMVNLGSKDTMNIIKNLEAHHPEIPILVISEDDCIFEFRKYRNVKRAEYIDFFETPREIVEVILDILEKEKRD